MGIEAQLLAAIRAAPHDDAPRLVYADHLMQHGDPRGEFIAAQIMRSIESRERWVELLREHRDEWTAHARRIYATNVVFERGFIERIDLIDASMFLAHADELATWAPVPAVHLTTTRSLATFAPDLRSAVISSEAPGGVRFAVHAIGSGILLLDRTIVSDQRWLVRYWFSSSRRLVVELGDTALPIELAF